MKLDRHRRDLLDDDQPDDRQPQGCPQHQLADSRRDQQLRVTLAQRTPLVVELYTTAGERLSTLASGRTGVSVRAAATYAGIPVTHRGLSTHFTVVTGHEDPTKARTDVDWGALARAGGTLVAPPGLPARARGADPAHPRRSAPAQLGDGGGSGKLMCGG